MVVWEKGTTTEAVKKKKGINGKKKIREKKVKRDEGGKDEMKKEEGEIDTLEKEKQEADGKHWDDDEAAMNEVGWMGEDHWIIMAMEFWKGPRMEGKVAYESLKTKDKRTGEELRRVAKGIRERMGLSMGWKARLEIFTMEWVTRAVSDKRPYEERRELREGINILRNLEKAREWVMG